MIEPTGLSPFVPSGPDFDATRALFNALGFSETSASDDYVCMRWGAAKFILQRFDNAEFASNFMISLEVPDLDAWWRAVEGKDLPRRFPGFRISPPKSQPWGREVCFVDLAGVCWHVMQQPA